LFGVPPSAASASPSLFNTSSSSPHGPTPAVEDVFGAAPQDSRDLFGAPPRTESAPPAVPVAPRAPRVVSPRAPPQAADNLFGAPPSATPASDTVFGGSSSSPREPLQATDNKFGAPPSENAPLSSNTISRSSPRGPLQAAGNLFGPPPSSSNNLSSDPFSSGPSSSSQIPSIPSAPIRTASLNDASALFNAHESSSTSDSRKTRALPSADASTLFASNSVGAEDSQQPSTEPKQTNTKRHPKV
jgi:hypothetical protein